MWQNKLFFCFIVLFAGVSVYFIHDERVVGWDESVYIGMGKYIASFGSVGLWEDIRPPGMPILLGFTWLFGIPYGYVSLLFFLGTMGLLYLILRGTAGLIAAVLFAVAAVEHSFLSMTHVPAAFFVLLAFYFYQTKRNLLTGLFVGVAMLFRFPIGLELIAFLLLYLFDRKYKDALKFVSGFFVVLVPFLLFNFVMYASVTSSFVDALFRPFIFGLLHQSNPFHQETVFFYIVALLSMNLLFAFALFGKSKTWVLAIVPLLYFTVIVNKQERFVLDVLPFIALLSAEGIMRFVNYRALVIVGALLMIPAIVSSGFSVWHDDQMLSFFSSFGSREGPTITTTPLPAAYSDHLFLPLYDNPDVALKLYSAFIPTAEHILYTDDFYPCFDASCSAKKAQLYGWITEHELVFNESGYLLFKK